MDKVAEQLLKKMAEKLSTQNEDTNLGEASGKGNGETEKLQRDLLSIRQELQEMKHKLSSTSDDDNAGLSHVTKIIEIHSKMESISITLLKSTVDEKANETTKLVDELNLEVMSLKRKLERAKDKEATLIAETDAAKKAEKIACESLSSLINQLREKNAILQNSERKVASLETQLENCVQPDGECNVFSGGAKINSLVNCVERLTLLLFEASSNAKKGRKTLLATQDKLQAADAQVKELKGSLEAINEKYEKEKKEREEEWEKKVGEFEAKIREANQSSASLMQQIGDLSRSLLVAESSIAALETKSESLRLILKGLKGNFQIITRVEREKLNLSNLSNPIVFMDISIDGTPSGRIIIEVLANEAPRAAENFRALCTGEKGVGKMGKPLYYKGSKFHIIDVGNYCAGGDFNNGDGTGNESADRSTFRDETFVKRYLRSGVLSMHSFDNGSTFFIRTNNTTTETRVFGIIVEGMDVLTKMDKAGPITKGVGAKEVRISDCGQLLSFR